MEREGGKNARKTLYIKNGFAQIKHCLTVNIRKIEIVKLMTA